MKSDHHYKLRVRWTGNLGSGTSDYRAYSRDHIVVADDKPDTLLSSDPSFRDDKSRHNPEELHRNAHKRCFVARSVNFPVRCEANGTVQPETG